MKAFVTNFLLPPISFAAPNDVRLAEAAMQGNRTAVRSLRQQETDVNAALVGGATALHWAVRGDDLETADMLIRARASIKAADRYGVTPLSLACSSGNVCG